MTLLATMHDVLWRSADAAAATGGRVTVPFEVSGIAINSRALSPGDLFIALKGDSHDGHQFVAAALAAKAAAALVSHTPDHLPTTAPLLIVPDVLEALWALARAARARTSAHMVAVTGSVGKTGTKEMIARIFEAHGPTAASAGNLNNHIGAPLSLARFQPSYRYGVFELGMNHAGEIRPLSQLMAPDVALITTVQPVHLEFFGSIEAIADAKAEIFEGLISGGAAVINRDDATFKRLHAAAKRTGAARIIGFGTHRDAEARLIQWHPDDDGGTIEAEIDGQVLCYRLSLGGRHWALNSVAALATAHAAGADLVRGARALAALTPLEGRGARHTIKLKDGDSAELIDESYNASPASVAAAIATLGTRHRGPESRRIAVLGDMLELGPDAARFHAELASAIERARIDLVFAAGPLMAALFAALPKSRRGAHAPNATALLPLVRDVLRAGDVVLVKGSHGSRTDLIVAGLLADAAIAGTEASRAL